MNRLQQMKLKRIIEEEVRKALKENEDGKIDDNKNDFEITINDLTEITEKIHSIANEVIGEAAQSAKGTEHRKLIHAQQYLYNAENTIQAAITKLIEISN